jgi:hypothetical protein
LKAILHCADAEDQKLGVFNPWSKHKVASFENKDFETKKGFAI